MTTTLEKTAVPSGARLVARLVDEPDLVNLVRGLAPAALGRLVAHVGLEDAGEIVALATAAQLGQLFDEDLWPQQRPGDDARFDAQRFGLWLAVLREAGADLAAEKLAGFDEDLVTLGLHQQLLVLDLDAMTSTFAGRGEDDERDESSGDAGGFAAGVSSRVLDEIEKTLASALCQEIDRFQIVARDPDNFDPLIDVLVALDRDQHELLLRLLERCAHLDAEQIEDAGGLRAALSAAETLADDVGGAREDRRARAGYVAPAAARSFLALAAGTPVHELLGKAAPDPIARAYFRAFELPAARTTVRAPPARARAARVLSLAADLHDALLALDILPAPAQKQLAGPPPAETPLRAALAALRTRDPGAHDRRLVELNFLANVLLSGPGLDGRHLRPAAAGEAVLAITNRGLEHALGTPASLPPDPRQAEALVEARGLIALFQVGWRLRSEAADQTSARPK